MQSQITDYYQQNKTPTYSEIIQFYTSLETMSDSVQIKTYGITDSGQPLHLVIIDTDKDFDPLISRQKQKTVLLINNGIHPGEPDGIDACIQLCNNLFISKSWKPDLKNLVICIVPVYNIDGCLNRNNTSRVNQDGPEEFGFRGNAQNYDLNRDFIKADSRNAEAFAKIFHTWNPDIFVDTHVSNGADYQYTMTLIAAQHNKLTPPLSEYLNTRLLPHLYTEMESAGVPMCPYVDPLNEIPDKGIVAFLETPRYSTGYAALFNTIGFMPETHMLKPYKQRVDATITLLKIFITYINADAVEIIKARNLANSDVANANTFPIHWKINLQRKDAFLFNGYEAKYKESEITSTKRLWYDRNAPFTKAIDYYNTYDADIIIEAPKAYIIPQAWSRVIEKMQQNNIAMQLLENDTLLTVEVYYINSYETFQKPNEGHYMHYNVTIRKEQQQLQFYKGDILIPVNQQSNRYIVETLEPQAHDSFFNWNYFDAILSRKEWFSDYVFEDVAVELLKTDSTLQKRLDEKKISDPAFNSNPAAQLQFIFENSKYAEKSYMRYPVYRFKGDL